MNARTELAYWINERRTASALLAQAITGNASYRYSIRVMLADRWIADLFPQVAA